jgi:hypothetical protein
MEENKYTPIKFTTKLSPADMSYLLTLLEEQTRSWDQAIALDPRLDEDRANEYTFHQASLARIHSAMRDALLSQFPP